MTASLVRGDHVAPKAARTTGSEWCDIWLDGYRTRRKSTVRQAEVHIKIIKERFGPVPLSAVKPSDVKGWTAKLKADGRAESYVYALHARLSQLFSDAVHDGIVPRNPCSRRTSPGAGCADALRRDHRPGVGAVRRGPGWYTSSDSLGAHAGLRLAEAAALRPEDVDFMRGVVIPTIQWPAEPLKSDTSRTPIPVPNELALELSAALAVGNGQTIVTNEIGRPAGPWAIQRAMRDARDYIEGLPQGFRSHDLRHYFASLLIASGLDVKTVQARLRHASAKTTLDIYGHLWPDTDEVIARCRGGRLRRAPRLERAPVRKLTQTSGRELWRPRHAADNSSAIRQPRDRRGASVR